MEVVELRTKLRQMEEERLRIDGMLSERTQRYDDYHETKTVSPVVCVRACVCVAMRHA